MGLIDADELKKELHQQWFMDILLTQRNSEDMFYTLAQKIDEQPTAYDVDKVAEKLEQKMKRARDKEQENTSEYFEGEADGFEFAIEIVKGGGNS